MQELKLSFSDGEGGIQSCNTEQENTLPDACINAVLDRLGSTVAYTRKDCKRNK